ncbi:MAG: NAD(P)/FAD-dependent oxidoreductase [Promethearchaeota archaeon]
MEIIDTYEVIIVGGGPAGLSAGIIASIKGLKTAVFEGGTFGGLLSTIYPHKTIYNYPATPRIRADHLVSEWVRQAADHDVILKRERVLKIHPNKIIETEGGNYSAKVVIIATGMRPNTLGIKGEVKFARKNRGVFPYVTDPAIFRDRTVLVVGGGDTALDAVVDLCDLAKEVYLAHRRNEFRAAEMTLEKVMKGELCAKIFLNTEIEEISGTKEVEAAILRNNETGTKSELKVDRVILAVGLIPNTEIFDELGLEMAGKYLKTDEYMRTNVEGIFAAGDIVSPYQLAVVAASQGALAAHGAYMYIRKPYWRKEHLKE